MCAFYVRFCPAQGCNGVNMFTFEADDELLHVRRRSVPAGGPFPARVRFLILARLRHADCFSQCPLLEEDRKGSAHGQNDAIDPKRPSPAFRNIEFSTKESVCNNRAAHSRRFPRSSFRSEAGPRRSTVRRMLMNSNAATGQ